MPRFDNLSAVVLTVAASLTGCGTGTISTSSSPETTHLAITGRVHGGQQPVAGAHVSVLQADESDGYGLGSQDLIFGEYGYQPPAGVTVGHPSYVTTDASGDFTITGDYQCLANGPVYLLATQGNPGLGTGENNPALAEMAVIATSCGSGATLSPSLQVDISEVTTVAAVYALSGFMTGPLQVSGSTGNTYTINSLSNAGATAMSLTNLSNGYALGTTASGGTVPYAKMNMLANILSACINSDGTGSGCSTLFTNTTVNGFTPADTVTALLNIAHNPSLSPAALTALYGLVTPQSPFQPSLTPQPTDFTLAVRFLLQYTEAVGPPLSTATISPNLPTIDVAGNVIIPGVLGNGGGVTLVMNNIGSQVSLATAGTGVEVHSNMWAIDEQGYGWSGVDAAQTNRNFLARLTLSTGAIATYGSTPNGSLFAAFNHDGIYVADYGSDEIEEFSFSGGAGPVYGQGGGQSFDGVGIDRNSVLYAVTTGAASVYAFPTFPPYGSDTGTGGGLSGPTSVAVDKSGAVWVTNSNNSLSKFTVTYSTVPSAHYILAAASPAAGYTGGGLSSNVSAYGTVSIVMDGASNAWVPNYAGQSISQFSNAGVAVSPAASGTFAGGYQTGCASKGLAVDSSGNVWVTCDNPNNMVGQESLIEFIGLATPTATPVDPYYLGVRP